MIKKIRQWTRGWHRTFLCALATGCGAAEAAETVVRLQPGGAVSLGTPSVLRLAAGQPFTVEGWVKLDKLTAADILYARNNLTSGTQTYLFGLTGNGARMAAYTGSNGDPVDTWREVPLPTGVVTGRWHHLAYAYDGADIKFYLDGAFVGLQPFNCGGDGDTTQTIRIGGHAVDKGLQGMVCEVRVWDHTRNDVLIGEYMHRRLDGREAGLRGYWPLNDGRGRLARDGTQRNDGALSGAAQWDSTTDLMLTAAPTGHLHAPPLTLADPLTGSTRFTGSNAVVITEMPVPRGCDHYQVTVAGTAGMPDHAAWHGTNPPPGLVPFPRPARETEVVLHAWFTNSLAGGPAHRAEGRIHYTTAKPVAAVRQALAFQRPPGGVVFIRGADIDAGSSGGVAGGTAMVIDRFEAVPAASAAGVTPAADGVRLGADGVFPLKLRLRNEAGHVVTAEKTCEVTVTTAATVTNIWTGDGGDNRWHNAANWSAGLPTVGQDAAILSHTGGIIRLDAPTAHLKSFVLGAGQALMAEGWDSAVAADNLVIAGTVTHGTNGISSSDWVTWTPRSRIWLRGKNITVAAGGILDADGKGYCSGQGPGSLSASTGGGGHAATGGFGNGNPGGAAYGDPAAPALPGSGGGLNSAGGAGGGVIRLEASEGLTIHGTVTAGGSPGRSGHAPGGSGGSLWLSCRWLAGTTNGLVRVNGGNGAGVGGGAAGGRIAVEYDTAAQAAQAEPCPPIHFEGVPGKRSGGNNPDPTGHGMGTLHLPDTRLIDGGLAARRLNHVRLMVAGWREWRRPSMDIADCVIGLGEGVDVIVAGNMVVGTNAALHLAAAPVADLRAKPGATLRVGGDLTINAGGWLRPDAHPTNGAPVLIAAGGNLHVAEGGGVDADRRGFTRGYGPGARSGGGYGGVAGMPFGGGGYGPVYGDAAQPAHPGSGGGSRQAAGCGGGAIRLEVAGDAVIDGTLTARGGSGAAIHIGAGSGGSIWLSCRTLSGKNSGLLCVDGGQGNYYGACGGGGRIAIHYDPVAQAALAEPVPPVRFSARAYPTTSTGDRFTINAQDGTLWLPDTLFLTERLDRQRMMDVRLVIPGFDRWSPSSLVLDNCAITLPEGMILDVAGDCELTNGAVLTMAATAVTMSETRNGAELNVGRDLRIATNCWIHPQAHPTNGAVVVIRAERDAVIAAGGGIDATARGYHGTNGRKLGPGQGGWGANGGGYGGRGSGERGGEAYGDAALPLWPGSAAGWGGYGGVRGYTVGGIGGGVVHLRAGREVRIDGLLAADGGHGSYHAGAGASGGSVFVAAPKVTGSGTLRARGGSYGSGGRPGGGGRIAVWHGMTSGEIESRLKSRSAIGLVMSAMPPSFGGKLDAGWNGKNPDSAYPPEAGSTGFYTPAP